MRTEGTYQGLNMPPASVTHLSPSPATTPGDDTARKLSRIWQEQLGLDAITPDQNFFDLGGDSSLAVRIFSQIEMVLVATGGHPTIGITPSFLLSSWSGRNRFNVPRAFAAFGR
jgi:hypothetical protein